MGFALTSFKVLKNSILISSQPNLIFLTKKEQNSAYPCLFCFFSNAFHYFKYIDY